MNITRRAVIQQGSAALAGLCAVDPVLFQPAKAKEPRGMMDTKYAPPGRGVVTGVGKGDFDFLAGQWSIRHRKRKADGKDDWIEFQSSATVHRVLDGLASIEELRNPNGSFMGMGVRTWLSEQQRWADHWTSAGNGVVNPPQLGRFVDGEGVFTSEETVDGANWVYRGVWDKITSDSCRWHQSSSPDGGKTWTWDWWMEWTRAAI